MSTLYVVATPIGNLEDITVRALRVLREVDLIAAEDTRVTRKLLARYEIETPLTSYREQNAAKKSPELLEMLAAGRDIALVSDAGTPAVNDPGAELVASAAEGGVRGRRHPGRVRADGRRLCRGDGDRRVRVPGIPAEAAQGPDIAARVGGVHDEAAAGVRDAAQAEGRPCRPDGHSGRPPRRRGARAYEAARRGVPRHSVRGRRPIRRGREARSRS